MPAVVEQGRKREWRRERLSAREKEATLWFWFCSWEWRVLVGTSVGVYIMSDVIVAQRKNDVIVWR